MTLILDSNKRLPRAASLRSASMNVLGSDNHRDLRADSERAQHRREYGGAGDEDSGPAGMGGRKCRWRRRSET
ncbi:hypothetical protein BC938DRAFT_472417 [Jimgerdemannia flammicorona]|uniref:Uncharacterized protein n=1 Tax=Jimgerdemannia flammicorona TaxID=994334 RepID=A0A433QTX3_9FUNG|nr:hypothetical protein BC938DRAFT_472417 [Jimgerdemannia flammicorona]